MKKKYICDCPQSLLLKQYLRDAIDIIWEVEKGTITKEDAETLRFFYSEAIDMLHDLDNPNG